MPDSPWTSANRVHQRSAHSRQQPGAARRLSGRVEKSRDSSADRTHQRGDFTFESGSVAAKQILDLQNRPTAIVASNDDMASGVVWVAQQRRLELPGDLSVAGFDDTQTALKSWPPLTVIRQTIDRRVEHGVSLLLDSLRTPTMSVPQDVVFDYTLVERASTSAVGARP